MVRKPYICTRKCTKMTIEQLQKYRESWRHFEIPQIIFSAPGGLCQMIFKFCANYSYKRTELAVVFLKQAFFFHVILLTILTLRAGGRFDSHFWTQSGAPSPYLAFRAPPRFQAIYGVESVPRFQPIFGIRSAPPPAFKLYLAFRALSSYIWCWKRSECQI